MLLVRVSRGAWTFPKGHIERGETREAAAQREVLEEAGVHATVIDSVGNVRYFFYDRGTLVSKLVHWYVMRWRRGEPTPDGLETVEARFFREKEVGATLAYENERKVWQRVSEFLEQVTAPETSSADAANSARVRENEDAAFE